MSDRHISRDVAKCLKRIGLNFFCSKFQLNNMLGSEKVEVPVRDLNYYRMVEV
jgi:hypothetical protein